MAIRKPTPKATTYPDGILESDVKFPTWPNNVKYGTKRYDNWLEKNTIVKEMEFYKTDRFGWVINTLHIRNASRSQRVAGVDTSRSYAIAIKNGQLCRVGLGPHVKERFTLYVRASRREALKKYVELFERGQIDANNARDIRSTRMMRGRSRNSIFSWLH